MQLCSRALDAFVELNPHFKGARWPDVLDILDNYDADLLFRESFEEQFGPMTGVTRVLALTIYYAEMVG